MLLSAFRPTTVRVPGAPTSRSNQALEFRCRLSNHALPIAAPGYRLSAHPWFQLGLLFWNVPPLRLPCWPTTITTTHCAGTSLVPGVGRSLLCQPAGTAGFDSRIIRFLTESETDLILGVVMRGVATEASLGTGACHWGRS